MRLTAKCIGFEQVEGGVVALFADGREEFGELLLGADGLHSAIRKQPIGDGPPRYAGYTSWRALVKPECELVPPGCAFETRGRGARLICTQIGGGRVYWAAAKNAPRREEEGLAASRRKSAVSEIVKGWHQPIEELVESTGETSVHLAHRHLRPQTHRESWSRGRMTLLGDAAHPMAPDLGQGACQAIEDAVALAECLGAHEDHTATLRAYEEWRVARANAIVRASRSTGRVAQLEGKIACQLRNLVVKAIPTGLKRRQLERTVGCEKPRFTPVSSQPTR